MARTTMTSAAYTMRTPGQRGNAGYFGRATAEKHLMIRKKWHDSQCRSGREGQIRK